MKNIVYTVIFSLIVVTSGACDNNNSDPKSVNTLSEAELTDREKEILSTTADKSFVFDFDVDGTYKEASVWVEKYESGKRVGDKNNHLTTELKDKGTKGTIIFASSKPIDNQSMFTASINYDGGISSGSSLDTITAVGLEDYGVIWGSNPEKTISIKGEMVLASICYSNEKNGISTISSDFYRDVDHHMNELKDYDIVYLLKSEFVK